MEFSPSDRCFPDLDFSTAESGLLQDVQETIQVELKELLALEHF